MTEIIDKLGKSHPVNKYRRIISLVPSITETLFDLGLESRIVGVTSFCIHPVDAGKKKIVGGTKTPSIERIRSLDPDIIITSKEETPREMIELLQSEFIVFVSFPRTIKDNLDLISDLGKLLEVDCTILNEYTKMIKQRLAMINSIYLKPKIVFCPIWKDPWISINSDTYIHNLLASFNLINICADKIDRYPVLDLDKLSIVDIVILPSEPCQFKEIDKLYLQQKEAFKNAEFIFIDGSYLSWYGTRFIKAADYLSEILIN